MNKFSFGKYNKETPLEDKVFTELNGYTDPSNESDTRKQLSTPLMEIKEFINDTAPVMTNDSNHYVQFGLSPDGLIKYRNGSDESFKDTNSSGHTIEVSNDGDIETFPQQVALRFDGATGANYDGVTVISGLKGEKGDKGDVGASFEILGRYDTYADLQEFVPSPAYGDAYVVGTSVANYVVYVYGTYTEIGPRGEKLNAIGWINLGALEIGPQGPKGDKGDSGGFEIKGMYSTYEELVLAHPTGSEGDAYAVGDSDDNVVYIWNTALTPAEWSSIGSLKGPQGETGGVPSGGTTGQILAKLTNSDFSYTWKDVRQNYDKEDADPLSGVAVGKAFTDYSNTMHPVGSILLTNSSTKPSLGLGENEDWELIDKEFKVEEIKQSDDGFNLADYFTLNTTNVNSVTNFKLKRSGRQIRISMDVKTKKEYSGSSSYALGTFNLSALGIGDFEPTLVSNYYSNSSNVIVNAQYVTVGLMLDNNLPTLRKVRSTGNVANGGYVNVNISPNIPMSDTDNLPNIDNSKCDKFYWRRIR